MLKSTLLAVILGTAAPAYADCPSLSPGHMVSGQALWGDAPLACAMLIVPVGKEVTVRVASSAKDVAFTIKDEVDNRDTHTFTTQKASYEIIVYRMFGRDPAAFELSAK